MPKRVEKMVTKPKKIVDKNNEVAKPIVAVKPAKEVKKEVAKPIVVVKETKKVVQEKETAKPVAALKPKKVVKPLPELKKETTKKVAFPKTVAVKPAKELKKEVAKPVQELVKPEVLAKETKKAVDAKPLKSDKKKKALFKLVQKYEYEDILKLKKFYFYNLKNNKMLLRYFRFIFIFTGVMFIFMELYLLSLFCFFMLFFYPKAIESELVKTSSAEYESNKLFELENHFSFYDDYFEVENAQTKAQIYFHQLHDLVEVEDSYYLFLSSTQAFVIKKSSIDENFFNYIKGKPGFHVNIQKTKRLFK
jgi:hypothetical protein